MRNTGRHDHDGHGGRDDQHGDGPERRAHVADPGARTPGRPRDRRAPDRAADRRRPGRPAPGARPRGAADPGPRRTLRREAPSTVALLADREDFRAMRSYATFGFDDHARYLRHAHGLLRSLTARGIHVGVVRFDPVQYAAYCSDTRQDPDSSTSRTRYVAEVAAGGATVVFRGQSVEDLLSQLDLATDRHATWRLATDALARAGDTGAALDRARLALTQLLEAAGPGTHHLVCSVPLDGAHLVAVLHAESDPGGAPRTAESDALVLCALLAAAFATGAPGGLVLRTGDGTPRRPDRVSGWTLAGGWPRPLTEAEVFDAYCTDVGTGDPVPPEPGVTYRAGAVIPPPRE